MEQSNGRLSFKSMLNNAALIAGVAEASRNLRSVGGAAEEAGNSVKNAFSGLKGTIADALSVAALASFAKQVAVVRGEFQQLEIAFKTMLNSKEQADALMAQLVQTAATTPFAMSDIAGSAKQLLAYGLEAEKVNETLIRLGDIAAGLSIPINDLAYLYGTTMVQGRLYTQDLNQFLNRGIPLVDELAKQFGVTKGEVKKLVEEGKVGFPQVEQAIAALTSEGSKFGGLMAAQSKTITGQISNIEDRLAQMFNEIGEKSEGIISDVLEGVGVAIEHWEEIGKAIAVVLSAYGAYRAALVLVWAAQRMSNIASSVSAFLSLTRSVTSAKNAMLLFNMVTSANPIGLIISLLAAAASAFFFFGDSAGDAAEITERFGKSVNNATSEVENLYNIMNIAANGSKVQREAMDGLVKVMEEYGIKVDKEKATTKELNGLHQQLIATIQQESIERERANAIDTFNTKYTESVKKAVEEAQGRLKRVNGGDVIASIGFGQIFNKKEEIQEYGRLLKELKETLPKAVHGYDKEASKRYFAAVDRLKEMDKAFDERAKALAQKMNLSGHEVYAVVGAFRDYRESVSYANSALSASIDNVEKATEAAQHASKALSGMTAEQRRAARQAQILKDHAGDLRTYLGKLANTYKITLEWEQVNTPEWMKGVSAETSKRTAAFYSSHLEDMAKKGVKARSFKQADGTYKTMTSEEVAKQAAMHIKNSEDKERIKKEQEEKEAARKREAESHAKESAQKAKDAARKAEQDRKRRADEAKRWNEETADRIQQIKEAKERIKEETAAAELDIAQKNIEAKQEGFEKEKAQLALNTKRLEEENKKRKKEMLQALADIKVNEWLNDPKNKNATKSEITAYRNSLLDGKSEKRLTMKDLSQDQQKHLEAYDQLISDFAKKGQAELLKRLLENYQDYETRKTEINKKFNEERRAIETAGLESEQSGRVLDELEKKRKEALKAITDEQVEAMQKNSTLFVELFEDAADKSDTEIKRIIERAKELLAYLKNASEDGIAPKFGFSSQQLKSLKESPEKIKDITEQVKKLEEFRKKKNPFKAFSESINGMFEALKKGETTNLKAQFKELANGFTDVAQTLEDPLSKMKAMFEAANGGEMAEAVEDLQELLGGMANVAKGFATGGVVGGVLAGVSVAFGWITKAFNASSRHKAALKAIQKETLAQQQTYALAILEERLRFEKGNTIFGNLDYSKATNSVNVLRDAYADLNRAVRGAKNAVKGFDTKERGRWGNILKDAKTAYTGLAEIQVKTGHVKTGLFGLGKGRDIYSSILDVYPELIDKQGNFNKELAETIINTRTFNGEGKEALQNIINLSKKVEEANEQIKTYLSGIFGGLGNNLSDALSDAFRNGTDAALAFGDSVSNMLEKLGKDIVFSTMFSGLIQEANEQMTATAKNANLSSEEKYKGYVEILNNMTDGILNKQGEYNALMGKLKEMSKDKGISIFETNDNTKRDGSQKGIATASQDSVDKLNGLMTSVQGHTFSINENTKLLLSTSQGILQSVMGIERNTSDVPVRLSSMEQSLKAVKDTLGDIAIKGIKIK